MGNERLRNALQKAGLQPDQLAEILEVDQRTVRRWLAGGTPYARHRGKIARALDSTEHQLWPQIPQPAITDSLNAYARADDPDAPTPETLIGASADRIDLLDSTVPQRLESPELSELLLAKASQGCQIRILTTAGPALKPLLGHHQIKISLVGASAGLVIHRADDQMLVALSLDGQPGDPPPLLHLRQHRAPGLFDRLARHYQHAWDQASETLMTEHDLDDYLRRHDLDLGPSDGARDPPAVEHDANQTIQAPPRHWPRRPH